MKKYLGIGLSAFVLLFVGCAGTEVNENSSQEIENEYEELSEMLEKMEESDHSEGDGHNHGPSDDQMGQGDFELMVPERMVPMMELNPGADAQYGFVQEVMNKEGDSEVFEHYLVVIMQLKSEINGYPVDLQLDAMKYRDDVIASLSSGSNLSRFEVLTEAPTVEKINGMDCVKNEMKATIDGPKGLTDLCYKLGVFEGDKAFYQVLTWCPAGQKEEFESDMDRIIDSFEEK